MALVVLGGRLPWIQDEAFKIHVDKIPDPHESFEIGFNGIGQFVPAAFAVTLSNSAAHALLFALLCSLGVSMAMALSSRLSAASAGRWIVLSFAGVVSIAYWIADIDGLISGVGACLAGGVLVSVASVLTHDCAVQAGFRKLAVYAVRFAIFSTLLVLFISVLLASPPIILENQPPEYLGRFIALHDDAPLLLKLEIAVLMLPMLAMLIYELHVLTRGQQLDLHENA